MWAKTKVLSANVVNWTLRIFGIHVYHIFAAQLALKFSGLSQDRRGICWPAVIIEYFE